MERKLCLPAKRSRDLHLWLHSRAQGAPQNGLGYPRNPATPHGLCLFLSPYTVSIRTPGAMGPVEPATLTFHGTLEVRVGMRWERGHRWAAPSSITPGPPGVHGAVGNWLAGQVVLEEDMDQARRMEEVGGGGLGAGVEGDGEAEGGGLEQQHLVQGRTSLSGHASPILHPAADRIINAQWQCPEAQPCWSWQEEAKPVV